METVSEHLLYCIHFHSYQKLLIIIFNIVVFYACLVTTPFSFGEGTRMSLQNPTVTPKVK